MPRLRRMAAYTVGVEEEYQLVDSATGRLESRARAVLDADWSGELRNEMQESTVEIGTRVCDCAADVEHELRRLRFQSATAAACEGLRIIAAGLHPTSRWQQHRLAGGDRYARIGADYGRIAQDEHNFGMHIHVAVPATAEAVRLLNVVRHYIPHLLALSCSSPYHEGADTGYASYRMILWRRWPNSGVPPHYASAAEYRAHVELLLRAGAIADERSLYWSIRPHPEYPTLEFRVTDVCLRLEDATAIAALARALVAAADQGRLREPWPHVSNDITHSVLAGNEWRAARYGLAAAIVDPRDPSGRQDVRDAIRRLVDGVADVAESLGDTAALERLDGIVRGGNGADRMRRTYVDCGGFAGLISWLESETMIGTGVERRESERRQAGGVFGV